jgi:hypothetical protein
VVRFTAGCIVFAESLQPVPRACKPTEGAVQVRGSSLVDIRGPDVGLQPHKEM